MTQKEKILQAFAKNNYVLTPSDIMRLGIAQYNARIFELKRAGHEIENEDLGYVDGVHLTRFHYKGKISLSTPQKKTVEQIPLFEDKPTPFEQYMYQ